jgi:hypothetical protein
MVTVQECGELDPGDEIRGQCGDVCPSLVVGEIKEGQLAQVSVLQGLDPVLASAPGAVPGIQTGFVPARRGGQKSSDPMPISMEQGRLRAGVQRPSVEEKFGAWRVNR